MKKMLFCAFALLTLICSCKEDSLISDTADQKFSTPLIESLAFYNKGIESKHTRFSIRNMMQIAKADLYAAAEGAKKGYEAGKFFGSDGSIVGAIVYGTIVGADASIEKYNELYKNSGCAIVVDGSGSNNSQGSSDGSLPVRHDGEGSSSSDEGELSTCLTPIEVLASIYGSQENQSQNQNDYIELIYPEEYDAIATRIAILHNQVLAAIDTVNAENITAADTTLSDIETTLINSPEFSIALDTIVQRAVHYESIQPQDEIDVIIQLFIDATSLASSLQEVTQIANDYIYIIEASNTLTFEQKQALYTAFAVGAYSFDYWTKYNDN